MPTVVNKKISLAFFLAAVVLAMALARRGDTTEGGGSDQRTSQGGPISAFDGDDSAVESGKMRDVVIPASEAGNADTSAFAALRTGSAKGQTDAVLGAGPKHPQGDLTAVGDEDLAKRRCHGATSP